MAKRGQGEGTISKRPDGTWWGRISLGYDENGKRKRKAFYGKTRKEVQEKLTAALAEINNDTYIEPSKMTVGQWMDIWLKEYKFNSIKPSTYDLYNQRVEAYIVPKLGGCKLQDLRNDIVQRFINSLVEKGLSSSVVTGTYMILHGALDQAVENGLLAKNPASKIKLPKVEHKKTRVFTPEEQEAFVKAAWKYRNGDMFVLMLATGLRVGEAIALTWDDIDLENRLLHVNKTQVELRKRNSGPDHYTITTGSPKTKSSNRVIPLIPEMVGLLEARKERQKVEAFDERYEDNNLVFCNYNGKLLLRNAVNDTLRCVAKKGGIDPAGLHAHCLRHTFATRGLENGIPLKVMQELLGHSSINMTANLYTHVLPNEKMAAIGKLSENFR